jgi:hypothetical protein
MHKIAIIRGYWDKEEDMLRRSISNWDTVTSEELELLKDAFKHDGEHEIIEQLDANSFVVSEVVNKYKKKKEEEILKEQKRIEERKIKELERQEKKRAEKLRLYEELKKEFE